MIKINSSRKNLLKKVIAGDFGISISAPKKNHPNQVNLSDFDRFSEIGGFFSKATELKKNIIITDASIEPRALAAAAFLTKQNIMAPILIGTLREISDLAKKNQIEIDVNTLNIFDPNLQKNEDIVRNCAQALLDKLQKNPKHKPLKFVDFDHVTHTETSKEIPYKELSVEKIIEVLKSNKLLLADMLVEINHVDGNVSGSEYTSKAVMQAGIQTIGSDPGILKIGSFFMMFVNNPGMTKKEFIDIEYPKIKQFIGEDSDLSETELNSPSHKFSEKIIEQLLDSMYEKLPSIAKRDDGTPPYEIMVITDPAVNPMQTPESMAQAAALAAQAAYLLLGKDLPVAFISSSTDGSNNLEDSSIAQEGAQRFPQIYEAGISNPYSMQLDTATVPEVAALKLKEKEDNVKGKAQILVTTQVGVGNPLYKQYAGQKGTLAIGPIVTGSNHGFHDLSRGATPADIALTIVIAALLSNTKGLDAAHTIKPFPLKPK